MILPSLPEGLRQIASRHGIGTVDGAVYLVAACSVVNAYRIAFYLTFAVFGSGGFLAPETPVERVSLFESYACGNFRNMPLQTASNSLQANGGSFVNPNDQLWEVIT